MDYEKKYKEALEGIQEILSSGQDSIKMSRLQLRLQGFFPELKESEDEKIRKTLIEMFSSIGKKDWRDIPTGKIIAWLEKQGKQKPANDIGLPMSWGKELETKMYEACKRFNAPNTDVNKYSESDLFYAGVMAERELNSKPADKIELKFKVGDWIINEYGFVIQITEVIPDIGLYMCQYNGADYEYSIEEVERNCRLWTIQDAKDGDILVDFEGKPFIFKGLLDKSHPDSPLAYCGILDATNNFYICTEENNRWPGLGVYPSTEKQRELLFSKMKEVGYKWDSESKVLIKFK